MKNTFGNAVTVTLFGESHGPAIGAVLDGLPGGIKIDEEYIAARLTQRRPSGRISTSRREPDRYEILSGVFNGYTTGTPLCIIIRNEDTRSKDYDNVSRLARPSHADLTAMYRYGGFEDYRGGGHFSGRITAALVAAGAIVMKALEDKGILIGTHISTCGGISDRQFGRTACSGCGDSTGTVSGPEEWAVWAEADLRALADADFPVLDGKAADEMEKKILEAASEGDSVGGVLETLVLGMPEGVGEPWFDTAEGMLAHAVFSVPAVKGIEFGAGFAITEMRGSQANDCLRTDGSRIYTETNNSGGINGGITSGMPIVFRTAIKPTPSIFKEQKTVDIKSGENAVLSLKGRHDPAIVHRAGAVINAVTALTLADLLAARFGTDWLRTGE